MSSDDELYGEQDAQDREDEEFSLAQELAELVPIPPEGPFSFSQGRAKTQRRERSETAANDLLGLENDVLDAYVSRVSPEIYEMTLDTNAARKTRRGKDAPGGKKERALTFEEKSDIAVFEIDHLHKRIQEVKDIAEREIDELQCHMEAIDIRIAETKKDTYEFKRDIIVGAENPRTGKTMAEKMQRFLEERLRVKEVAVEKLKLKNSTVRVQITKMEQQLQQKEEMGEVLHVIDFDQLKIENQQYLEKIEERNNELLRMKLSTGRTIQTLNNMKNRLMDLVTEGQRLRKDISERENILARFHEDMQKVQEGRKKAGSKFKTQKLEAEDTDRPQVMDYIYLTAEVQNIQKQLGDWDRKLEIAQMEEKRTRKMYKTLSQSMQGMTPPMSTG